MCIGERVIDKQVKSSISFVEKMRRICIAILCLTITIWCVAPAPLHQPVTTESLLQQAEMIADHGHTHGPEENLYHVLHGHSHDVAEHDHSIAIMPTLNMAQLTINPIALVRREFPPENPWHVFPFERPPRS